FAHQDLGQHDAAFRLLDDAIRACPECAAGYQAKAMLYRDAGKLAEARKTLEAALGSMGDRTSAEIHYLLGLVLLDLDELAAAEEHARRAYELGYPLPGLRERL